MLSQRSAIAKGLLVGLLKPRVIPGTALPMMALDAAARHLGRKGFDAAEATTMIRKAGAGLLDPSADLDDLPEFFAAVREILNKEDEATDTEGEPQMSAQEIIAEIRRLVSDLSPDDFAEVAEFCRGIAEHDPSDGPYEGEDGNAAARHSHLAGARRLGRDMPLHTHPLPGEGEDARRRQANDLALDAALARYERDHPAAGGRDFARRFPDAARIRVIG